jgi:hypothetical protein
MQADAFRRQAAQRGEFGGDGGADRLPRRFAFILVSDADDDDIIEICN